MLLIIRAAIPLPGLGYHSPTRKTPSGDVARKRETPRTLLSACVVVVYIPCDRRTIWASEFLPMMGSCRVPRLLACVVVQVALVGVGSIFREVHTLILGRVEADKGLSVVGMLQEKRTSLGKPFQGRRRRSSFRQVRSLPITIDRNSVAMAHMIWSNSNGSWGRG